MQCHCKKSARTSHLNVNGIGEVSGKFISNYLNAKYISYKYEEILSKCVNVFSDQQGQY